MRMPHFTQVTDEAPVTGSLTLDHNQRQKTRFRAELDGGGEVTVLLPRGTLLFDGTRLRSDDGHVIEIRAATEALSAVTADHPLELARAAYHLGNRHVPVRVEAARLLYAHDHVLDDMIRELGLTVSLTHEPFEPEPGAYGQAGGGHGHASSHHHTHH